MPDMLDVSKNYVVLSEAVELLKLVPDDSVDVVYTDPPFNSGVNRSDPRDALKTYRDDDERGVWLNMLREFAVETKRILKPSGNLFLHLDWRGVHEAKVFILDQVLGNDNYLGEVIWSYNWGARQKTVFSRKHDTILHYSREPGEHRFDEERVDRVPYKAPSLQMYRAKRLGKNDGAARIARGQHVTDVFTDINVLGTSSHERALNSYPTMKPTKLIRRLIAPTVVEGSVVVDPFCGSGTTVEAAVQLGCRFVVGDSSERAYDVVVARAERLRSQFVALKR